MDAFLDFARGPLFRLTFALMILGLMRLLILTAVRIILTYIKAGDKQLPWKDIILKTLSWLFPVKKLFTKKPVYSIISFIFHIGLILTPIFLFAHIELWRGALGFGWPALPRTIADILTIVTIAGALLLFIGRIGDRRARILSRKQDYLWPLVLLIPFLTGFLCANAGLSPAVYKTFTLIHILSAELIFILIPFTKIAHCVLFPLSHLVSVLGWKFPADAGENVAITLKKKGVPV
ncbi:MAG: hypothetical protein HQ591_11680 [candidate division Zixibacteria bacterium]|nr:hypothetical protein [Candidatus Tariuqbacter arcticus]